MNDINQEYLDRIKELKEERDMFEKICDNQRDEIKELKTLLTNIEYEIQRFN